MQRIMDFRNLKEHSDTFKLNNNHPRGPEHMQLYVTFWNKLYFYYIVFAL